MFQISKLGPHSDINDTPKAMTFIGSKASSHLDLC